MKHEFQTNKQTNTLKQIPTRNCTQIILVSDLKEQNINNKSVTSVKGVDSSLPSLNLY